MTLNGVAAFLEGFGLLLLLPLLVITGLIDGAIGSLGDLALPQVLIEGLKRLETDQRLMGVLAIFVGLLVLQSAAFYAREQHTQRLRLCFVDSLRERLFGTLADARWGFLARHHSSEFLSVLTTDIQRVGQGTYLLLSLFTQLALLPVYIFVACRLSVHVTLIAMVVGLALWWLLRKSRVAARQSGTLLTSANKSLFSTIQEFLSGLKLIKIHGEEDGYRRQFHQAIEHLRAQQLSFAAASSQAQAIFRIGGAVALAALVYTAISIEQLSTPALLLLIAVYARMLPQVALLHQSLQQLSHATPAFENWQRWSTLTGNARDSARSTREPSTMTRGILLQDLSYRHSGGGPLLQASLTLIPAHRTTAIVGASGAGKTTLLDLISGLNSPDNGQVLIDGQPMERHGAWHRRIAYLPQETVIFDGTLRDNLTWGSADVSDSQIQTALQQAAAASFVHGLPAGLQTWVGERGIRLSGGERQRLGLARALLRKPELLILDEATNALDAANQALVFNALRALHGQMTVLIVTHRYEEIRELLDGLVCVEDGSVSAWQPLRSRTSPQATTA